MTGWSLDIQDMSWVEHTREEVEFVVEALGLAGSERVLDLACGFGRHSLELARRGYSVVGVDYTPAYIAKAREDAADEGLDRAEFVLADVREVAFREEFDVVLNIADGAVGYFQSDAENLRLFDVIAASLKPGGKHVVGICSAAHVAKHSPKRHWEAGSQGLSLADFTWDATSKRMIYRGRFFRYGEPLPAQSNEFPDDGDPGTRLYTLEELAEIFAARGMHITAAYAGYDTSVPASAESLMQVVCSVKECDR